MEKKTLHKLLMDRCFWRAATVICLVLALQFLVLSLWQDRRNPGRAENFAEGGGAGRYVQLSVAHVSDVFARRGEENFYFLADPNDYIYVAVLSDRQYFDLLSILDGGAEQAAVAGMSTETPYELQRVVCECFEDIEYEDYTSYFGVSYLDCTRTPFTEAYQWLMVTAAAAGALCVISLAFWFLRRRRVRRMLSRLEGAGKLAAALSQINNASPAQVEGALTVTEGFICDTRTGTLIARSEMQNPELRGYVFKRGRLRARCTGRSMTVARLSEKQRMRIKDMLRIPKDILTAGRFVAPRYWDIPNSGQS